MAKATTHPSAKSAPAKQDTAVDARNDADFGNNCTDCTCDYAAKSWHDAFMCIEDDLGMVVSTILAAEGEDLDDLRRFVALHEWSNRDAAYSFAELIEHFMGRSHLADRLAGGKATEDNVEKRLDRLGALEARASRIEAKLQQYERVQARVEAPA